MNAVDEILRVRDPYRPKDEEYDISNAPLSIMNGWSQQAVKDRNALDVLFQGAVMSGDLDKATRLASTPEQRAFLDVAYSQRMNDQDRRARMDAGKPYDAPTNLVGDYRAAQEAKLANSRMEQDRQMKIQKFYNDQAKEKAQTDLLQANAKNAALKPVQTTKAQGAVDTNFAKDYVDWKAAGGYADVEKQLAQLSKVSGELGAEGNNYTGPYRGLLPDKVRAITNPNAVAAKNAVEEVAQRNLRLVLGAQFTQVEGERLIARAYNDQMSPAENKRRVDALFGQIRTAAKAKEDAAQYYEQNGTLAGWKGRLPTLDDFYNAVDGGQPTNSSSGRIRRYNPATGRIENGTTN